MKKKRSLHSNCVPIKSWVFKFLSLYCISTIPRKMVTLIELFSYAVQSLWDTCKRVCKSLIGSTMDLHASTFSRRFLSKSQHQRSLTARLVPLSYKISPVLILLVAAANTIRALEVRDGEGNHSFDKHGRGKWWWWIFVTLLKPLNVIVRPIPKSDFFPWK